jgi:hypothetical protein
MLDNIDLSKEYKLTDIVRFFNISTPGSIITWIRALEKKRNGKIGRKIEVKYGGDDK